MLLHDILSELRQDSRIKQKDLAQYLNVSVATISHYESGSSLPDVNTLVKLANYYGVSVDYILGRVRLPIDYAAFQNKIRLPDGNIITLEDVINAFIKLSDTSQVEIIKLMKLYKLNDDVRHAKFMMDSSDTPKLKRHS